MSIRNKLAEYAHDAWARWMKYLFEKCDHTQEGLIIPAWAVKRWERQLSTPYSDLSAEEKKSDRVEADRMLKIMSENEKTQITVDLDDFFELLRLVWSGYVSDNREKMHSHDWKALIEADPKYQLYRKYEALAEKLEGERDDGE